MDIKKPVASIIALSLVMTLAGCSSKTTTEEVESTRKEIIGDTLASIVNESQTIEQQQYYSVTSGDSTYKEGIQCFLSDETIKGVEAYAVSGYNDDSSAYTVAIMKTNDITSITELYKNYAEKLSTDLYTEHYEESVIASTPKIGSVYDYCMLVIAENADEIYNEIEDNIIIEAAGLNDNS